MQEQHQNRSGLKKLSIFIRISVAAAAITILCFSQDWSTLANVFSRLSPSAAVAALVCMSTGNIIIGLRWLLLLRTQKIDVRFWPTMRIHFVGLFYNNILLSSVGGDMLRAWYVSKHTARRFEAALTVLVDRLVGLFTLVLMAFAFYWLYPVDIAASEAQPKGSFSFRASISENQNIILTLLVLLFIIVLSVFIIPFTRRIMAKALFAVTSRKEKFFTAAKMYFRRPFVLLGTMLLTLVAQSVVVTGFYLIGRSLGLDVSIKYYFVFFPISWVIAAIPISPGGYGVLELGLVGLFLLLPGVSTEAATALAISQRLVFLICSVPGVIIHVSGFHLPAKAQGPEGFFVDSGRSED